MSKMICIGEKYVLRLESLDLDKYTNILRIQYVLQKNANYARKEELSLIDTYFSAQIDENNFPGFWEKSKTFTKDDFIEDFYNEIYDIDEERKMHGTGHVFAEKFGKIFYKFGLTDTFTAFKMNNEEIKNETILLKDF